jgi:hypothetical protein
VVWTRNEKYQQLHHRLASPFIRHVLELLRQHRISTREAAAELEVSPRRACDLHAKYLKAYALGKHRDWQPGRSGGNHAPAWPPAVCDLLRRRLSSRPASPYSFAASEAQRLCSFRLDRSQVRHWAIRNGLAHREPPKKVRAPIRRWQRQQIGELWQLDATPHAWFPGDSTLYPMLNMLDDCSRLFVGSKIYERENLLAYMDFLPTAFLEHGFPLALYVDYHSLFFAQNPVALTELGRALKFYGVAFRYAPTPQAKGKVEREHQYWQGRLPSYFAAEHIHRVPAANEAIRALRHHRNRFEPHRELGMTAQTAWDLALSERRSVLRPATTDAWWPYVWSAKHNTRVSDDGRIQVGNHRMRLEVPPRTSVVLCQHPDGGQSVLAQMPDPARHPVVLFTNRAK